MTEDDTFSFAESHMAMAREYGMAAARLETAGQTDAPFWHAVAHTLELSLKGLLLETGMSQREVMDHVGHNLQAALSAYLSRAKGSVGISPEAIGLIACLSEAHAQNDFRYPHMLTHRSLPEPHQAARVIAEHLISCRIL